MSLCVTDSEIRIPGLSRAYTLLRISDAHEGELAAGRTQYTAAPAWEGFVRRLRITP